MTMPEASYVHTYSQEAVAEIPDGRYRPQHDASDVLLHEQRSVQEGTSYSVTSPGWCLDTRITKP